MIPRLIRPRRFADQRGWFCETYNVEAFVEMGISEAFVQDNHSMSRLTGTLRGIHCQAPPYAQAKLVRCSAGAVFDVAVDLRRQSPTFGRWVGAHLTAEDGEQLYVPVGFGHGFVTLTDSAEVQYKCSAPYAPASEAGVIWNDPAMAITWPLPAAGPILSDKDAVLPGLDAFPDIFPYDGTPLAPLED